MKLLTLQVPEELHSQLFHAAARHEVSASLYVRNAIREKLARESAGDVVSFRPPTAAADASTPDAPTSRTPEQQAIFDRMRANMARAKGLI